MDDAERLRRNYLLAIAQYEVDMLQLNIAQHIQGRQRWRRGQRNRQFWTRGWILRRKQFGLYDQLMVELRQEDPRSFTNFMRMPPAMYDEILERIRGRITKQYTWWREPLEPGLKLAITLRHIASGSKYSDMKFGWRVPANTISIIVREVCKVIVEEYIDEVMTPPTTPEVWRLIAEQFMKRWNFPHCCGALDGKHVACRCPNKSGSTYYNYKGFYSIVMLALVDSDYKFIWADVGGKGAASDAQIYNASELKECLEDGSIRFPAPDPLPNDTENVPYFIIGDDAFALTPTMMKPYSHRGMTDQERIYNYRLSRARRVVENGFGILANRFQVLLTTMNHAPSTVRLIVTACMCLHNMMRIRYPGLQNDQLDREDPNHNQVPGLWRLGRNLHDTINVRGPNIDHNAGKRQRNLLRQWCNSEAGSVTWQDDMI